MNTGLTSKIVTGVAFFALLVMLSQQPADAGKAHQRELASGNAWRFKVYLDDNCLLYTSDAADE